MAAVDAPDLPDDVLAGLRRICLALPEVVEEAAWVGRRWVVRRRTFAQAFVAEEGTTPVLIDIARAVGPGPFLVFRSTGPELEALRHQGPPFHEVGWGREAMGVRIGDDVGWAEIEELLTESYCLMAPDKLVRLVERPTG